MTHPVPLPAASPNVRLHRMNQSHPTSTSEPLRGAFPHPIDLLRRLASTSLPIRVADQHVIETLRILKLGGSIRAAIPEASRLPGGLGQADDQASATVDEITRLGRTLLERFAKRRMPAPMCARCP